MELKKKFNIGKYKVNLALSSLNGTDGNYVFQYGMGGQTLQSFGGVSIQEKTIEIKTDYFSSQRIYYWIEQDNIYITDDVRNFIRPSKLDNLERDEFEVSYLEKHGYTSGDSTIYKLIKKLPPASKLLLNEDGPTVHFYWDLNYISNTPDNEKLESELYSLIKNQLTSLKELHRPIVLCFSGGKDSTYLAKILNELEIPHMLVFFRDTELKVNNTEILKAKAQAKKLDHDLTLIDITSATNLDIEKEIEQFNKFDRHYCRYHYYGLKILKEKFGEDVIIINGQNADSIFSYGPSEKKISSMVKRYLLYGNNIMIKRLSALIIGILFSKKLYIPKNDDEKLAAFYDNFKYCLLLDKWTLENKDKIVGKLEKLRRILVQNREFGPIQNFFMYIKVFTHMQGSDAQVVLRSAKYFGLDLIMPFSDPNVIKTTLRYKNDRKEMLHPKYALDKLL